RHGNAFECTQHAPLRRFIHQRHNALVKSKLRDDFVCDPDLDIDERIPNSVNVKGHIVVPCRSRMDPGGRSRWDAATSRLAVKHRTSNYSRRFDVGSSTFDVRLSRALTFYVGQLGYRSVDRPTC